MSHCYYNGGYNNTFEVDHRYEEIPDIDPSMDFLDPDDTSETFYYMESPTRLPGRPDAPDPSPAAAERSFLLRAQHQHSHHYQQLRQSADSAPPAIRTRRSTPPPVDRSQYHMYAAAAGGGRPDRTVAAVTPCKARRRLDAVYGECTVSLPTTPSGSRSADVFAPMMAQTSAAAAAKPVTVRRARSSATLYNKHKRTPEFLSEYNLDTCVPVTGIQYDRPRNTAVIQPIYKAPSSVFQVIYKTNSLYPYSSKKHFQIEPNFATFA